MSTLVEAMAALERIAALDPSKDSVEGWNEWGEADCFQQAQEIARAAIQEHSTTPPETTGAS